MKAEKDADYAELEQLEVKISEAREAYGYKSPLGLGGVPQSPEIIEAVGGMAAMRDIRGNINLMEKEARKLKLQLRDKWTGRKGYTPEMTKMQSLEIKLKKLKKKRTNLINRIESIRKNQ